MRRSLWILVVVLVSVASKANAQEATLEQSSETRSGFATLVGPSIGWIGGPTAFEIRAEGWHQLTDTWGIAASLSFSVGGEEELESASKELPPARLDVTYGTGFRVGVRYVVPDIEGPFAVWLGAAAAFDLVATDASMVGYVVGPALQTGVGYALDETFSLVAEIEAMVGMGQLKGLGQDLVFGTDILVGAQVAF